MSFRFIHAADLHLDSQLRGLDRYDGAPVDEIRGATRRALENLVDLAVREQVACVIIAGDVYDGDWQDFNTGLFFVRQMSRLREANIAVVLIRGNHDATSRISRSLELPDNVCSLSTKKPQTVEGRDIGYGLAHLDVTIHGQGFHSAAVDENVVLNYPAAKSGAFNIGVLHTSLEMEAGGEHARYAPCAVSDLLARHYDYWALGHVHRRRIVHDDPPIVYPGNVQGRHIRETGVKGCMLVSVDERGQIELEFQPLDVFRWYELPVSIDGAAGGEEVLGTVAAQLREFVHEYGELPLALRVVLTGACDAHLELAGAPERWINQVRALASNVGLGNVWIEQVRFRTTPRVASRPVNLDDGPWREVAGYLEDLRADDALLAPVVDQLSALARKIPDELAGGDDGDAVRLNDPQYLRQLLDQVEPLLLTRLQSREADG
jgi:DNA repair exonuclease SbcCD nuclease subunit